MRLLRWVVAVRHRRSVHRHVEAWEPGPLDWWEWLVSELRAWKARQT